jgi:tRNA-Thr(GGU) m(6)t(6)A37 methyltransferase TsaA
MYVRSLTTLDPTSKYKNDRYEIRPIARIYTDFNERFGIPRQSGLVPLTDGKIVFEPEFRNVDAIRGLDGFSHIWLIWGFSETRLDMSAEPPEWKPTVRPPRLGGEERMGVFATRSPYRPNSLGLSSVSIQAIDERDPEGPVIYVRGADILNGSPVYDIKPYLQYTDCRLNAMAGFADGSMRYLQIEIPDDLMEKIDEVKRQEIMEILALDPRGAYEKKEGYSYGLSYANYDIKFTVKGDILTVTDVVVEST